MQNFAVAVRTFYEGLEEAFQALARCAVVPTLPEPLKARAQIILEEADFNYCRVCGCSDLDSCAPPCGWIEEKPLGLCSSCAKTGAMTRLRTP